MLSKHLLKQSCQITDTAGSAGILTAFFANAKCRRAGCLPSQVLNRLSAIFGLEPLCEIFQTA